MPRPDFSEYVVHFTKGSAPLALPEEMQAGDPLAIIPGMTAAQRLTQMLEQRLVLATPMPWTNARAVAFTECAWTSLLDHARRYSPFGIGFHKAFLFAVGGGPAIYLRQDLLQAQRNHVAACAEIANRAFDTQVWAFVTPFVPSYAARAHRDEYWRDRPIVDYTHEREWRVPHNLPFEYRHVAFVIVDTYQDMAAMPGAIKDAIGRDKFLIMSNYRQVEKFWPTHVLTP